jgi:hypothetical protein
VFSLLRLKLNRARRRYIIKILRTTRNILWEWKRQLIDDSCIEMISIWNRCTR